MTTYTYKLTSYRQFLQGFARFLGTTAPEQVLRIPEAYGRGFMKALSFNDVDALLYDLTLTRDLQLRREKDGVEYYTLNFDELGAPGGGSVTIKGEALPAHTHRKAYLYLTSFLYEVDTFLQKDVPARGIRIFLPVPWLRRYLHLGEKDDLLEQYIRMKATGICQKIVDPISEHIVQELLADQQQTLLFHQNRMLQLVELFFDWLHSELQTQPPAKPLTRNDILAARRIERLLTTDITVVPPTIREMSRQFAMSESKLKKVFKTVFGLPPYEYYQKKRMQQARQLLISGNYSIKDVGYTLGYSNLSNFTLAFKKEFGKLPSQVVREGR